MDSAMLRGKDGDTFLTVPSNFEGGFFDADVAIDGDEVELVDIEPELQKMEMAKEKNRANLEWEETYIEPWFTMIPRQIAKSKSE